MNYCLTYSSYLTNRAVVQKRTLLLKPPKIKYKSILISKKANTKTTFGTSPSKKYFDLVYFPWQSQVRSPLIFFTGALHSVDGGSGRLLEGHSLKAKMSTLISNDIVVHLE